MANAWGIWTNHKVSKFNFAPAVAAGCSFAVGTMNTGWKQYNTNFAPMVQAAYDAGLRNIGGVYHVNPNEFSKMIDLMTYLEYPNGKFDGNFPIIKEIYEIVRNKYLSFLVIEIGDWWLEDGDLAHRKSKRVAPEHYRAGCTSIVEYLRDHMREVNPKIADRIVPMWSKWTIDNIYPELKGLFAGELVCSDFNMHPKPLPLSSYSTTIGMTRPPKPMDVSYGSDWRFVRWANASFKRTDTDGKPIDFDNPIGIADFHGSPAQLSAWTGQPVVNVVIEPEPEPDNEPSTQTPVSTLDIRPGLIEYLQSMSEAYERLSVEYMGLKHLTDDYIENLLEE